MSDDLSELHDAMAASQPEPGPSTKPGTEPKADDISDLRSAMMASQEPSAADLPPPAPPPKRMDLSNLSFAQKVASVEAGGNPQAKNPHSSALGLGQFMAPPNTPPSKTLFVRLVKQYQPEAARGLSDAQILGLRTNSDVSSQAIEAYGNENGAWLKKQGVPVNDASKYGAHWFGPAGFSKLYNAEPNTPVTELFSPEIIRANRLQGKTSGDVLNLIARKMGMDFVPQEFEPHSLQSWAKVGSEALQNAPSSVAHQAAGIYEAVRHPIETGKTLWQIGKGLDSKIEGYAGRPQDPIKKGQNEALVDALAHSYADKYGSLEGFQNALAHDPAGILMDVATLLTGGEMAGARVAGALGKAGEIASATGRLGEFAGAGLKSAANATSGVAKIAGTTGRMINPLDPGGLISGAITKVIPDSFGVADRSSALHPEVRDALGKAAGNVLSAEDVSALDPVSQAAFRGALENKGIAPAAVNEGILRAVSPDMHVPTSVVTGVAPPEAAREAVGNAVARNNGILAREAAELAGGSEPSGFGLGSALEEAHVNSSNASHQLYHDLRDLPGSFGASLDGKKLDADIGAELGKYGLPSTPLLIERSAAAYPQANKAINLIQSALAKGETRLGGEITAPELMEVRRQLTDLRGAADGSDIKAVGAIIDAFHKHLEDAGEAGQFLSDGKPVTDISARMKAANQAYREHFERFENRAGPNATIANAIKTLKSSQGRDVNGFLVPSGDSELQLAAQKNLARKLFDPHEGPATYSLLVNAFGGEKSAGALALKDFIKQSALANDGASLQISKNVANLIAQRDSVIAKAFSDDPAGLARARLIHAAHRINNTRPTSMARQHALLSDIWGKALARAATGAAGYHAHGVPGLIAGEAIEGVGEHLLGQVKKRRAMSGAPKKHQIRRHAARLVKKAISAETVLPAHYLSEATTLNNPVHRASGGGVREKTVDELVARLMRLAKHARQRANQATKPLLKEPDALVAKALEIAQRAI